MSNNEIYNKLEQIKTEDYIWLIYIGIIIYSFNNNQISKRKYRKSLIIIFSILIVVYLYFFKSSLDDVNNLKPWDSIKKKNLVNLSFIASLLITVSGLIFLYIAYNDEDLNVELAFN